MFSNNHQLASVTVILPQQTAAQVVQKLTDPKGTHALVWPARGTLLHHHWMKRWFPPISPAKTMLQVLVPNNQVDDIVGMVVDMGKLSYQATGAVFSAVHEHAYLGSAFHTWPGEETPLPSKHKLSNSITAIYCIVNHELSDKVSKAAIHAGAHGPIVYYCNGRGLRDRLGWLRITKENENEILMVLCEDEEADDIFDTMAAAAEIELPGNGIIYKVNLDKGLFNLPSRMAHHHHDASLQQIIHAIDHLQGHNHWRDQSVFEVGAAGRGSGVNLNYNGALKEQSCLTAIVRHSQMDQLADFFLSHGAPGMNFTFTRFTNFDELRSAGTSQVHDQYAILRSVVTNEIAQNICQAVDAEAEALGMNDMALLVNPLERVMTYVPSYRDFREKRRA